MVICSLLCSVKSMQSTKPKKLELLSIELECGPVDSGDSRDSQVFIFINKDNPTLSDLRQAAADSTGKSIDTIQLMHLGKNITTQENIKKDILLRELGIIPDGENNQISCV